jgi:hypothetical protein
MFSHAIDPTATQNRDLDWGDGREVRVTWRPDGGPYNMSGSFRYGRANTGTSRRHASEAAGPERCFIPAGNPYFTQDGCFPGGLKYYDYWVKTGENWSDSSSKEREEHLIADFMVGQDVGLGSGRGYSTLSGGLRFAQFESTTWALMDGIPNTYLPDGFVAYPMTFDHYRSELTAEREFSGSGPALSWDATRNLWGDNGVGHVNLDWSVAGGVLFGKQKTSVTGTEGSAYTSMKYGNLFGHVMTPLDITPIHIARSEAVAAPFVDLKLGLSYEIERFKVGAGYRWERYYNVLDGGYDEHKDYNRTIDGPYVKIALGFGG